MYSTGWGVVGKSWEGNANPAADVVEGPCQRNIEQKSYYHSQSGSSEVDMSSLKY